MRNGLKQAARRDAVAHSVACRQAWRAVGAALCSPGTWLLQCCELLVWGLKMLAATFLFAMPVLFLLHTAYEGVELESEGRRVALFVAGTIVAILAPFVRAAWPASPFLRIWRERYDASRAGVDQGE